MPDCRRNKEADYIVQQVELQNSSTLIPQVMQPFKRFFFVVILSLFALQVTTVQAQTIEWLQLPGSVQSDIVEDVATDGFGNSFVTGKFAQAFFISDTGLVTNGREDVFIAKYDTDGNLLWLRGAGGPKDDVGIEVATDTAGSVYVAGRFEDSIRFDGVFYPGFAEVDIFVVKYDKDGVLQWVRTYGASRDDRCRGLSVTPDGFVYLAGRYRLLTKFGPITLVAEGGAEDVYLAKLDQNGIIMWARTMGGPGRDFGEDVIVDSEGNAYVTGSYFRFMGFEGSDTVLVALGDEEGFLVKYDTDGNFQWALNLGSEDRDYGESLAVDEFDNVHVVGSFAGTQFIGNDTLVSLGGLDMFLAKINPQGEVLWTFAAGASVFNDVAWGVDYDKGNVLMTGWYRGNMLFGDQIVFGANNINFFAGKVNAAGKATWVTKLGNNNSLDIGRGISVDPAGDVYVGGAYQGTATYGTTTTTALGESDVLYAKLQGGANDCAISHAYIGDITECGGEDTTYSVQVTLYHYNAPVSGQLNVNGQLFPIGGNEQTVLLTSLPPISGFRDVEAFFTADSVCSYFQPNAFITPESCDPCRLDSIAFVGRTGCSLGSNRYNARVQVFYTKAPESGVLVVNGQEFPITGSPQTVDLTGLYADSLPVDITAFFSEDPFCDRTAIGLFVAPPACNNCQINSFVLNEVNACDPFTNTYSASVTINYKAWPPTGGLIVNGHLFDITAPPQTVLLDNLVPDGLPLGLDVSFEGDSTCANSFASLLTAPLDCDTCSIVSVSLGAIGRCQVLEGTYSADLLVEYANPPLTGGLVLNGDTFALEGSPQIITLDGLPSDGLPFAVNAFFTARPACLFTDTAVFTAPDTCLDCAILGISVASDPSCDPATNLYSAELEIDYINAPGTGNLLINGQSFAVSSSPQIVELANLPTNGLPVSVSGFFTEDVVCAFSVPDLFTAALPCDTCTVIGYELVEIGRCDVLTSTYEADLLITYANEPGSGSLSVNGALLPITGSPQLVTLDSLPLGSPSVALEIFFTADSLCRLQDSAAFASPVTCLDCGVTGIAFNSVTAACSPLSNTYSASLTITSANTPDSGMLVVNGQSFAVLPSPQTVVLSGLVANGAPVSVTASYTADSLCTLTVPGVFVAPAACDSCARPFNLTEILDPISPTTIIVQWNPMPLALSYQVRGRRLPSTNFGFVQAVTNGRVINNLLPGRTYGWSVRANCATDTSAWSVEETFTTFSARFMEGSGELADRVTLTPNPSFGPVHMLLQSDSEEPVYVRLFNLQGALMQQVQQPGLAGQVLVPLDLSGLAEGLYLVEVIQGSSQAVMRVQLAY